MRLLLTIMLAGAFFSPAVLGRLANAAQGVYYEPDIREIIAKDCARCHSGVLRNLMSYKAVKAYADSGMLEAMLQSLMKPFAGSDAPVILDWIAAGAPERGPGAAVPPAGDSAAPQATPAAANQVYYEPTIRDIIRKDCGRCHTGGARSLTDWDSVRAAVDNGMLAAMLQGAMPRVGGGGGDILPGWIDAGAPENPPRFRGQATPAAFGTAGPPPDRPGKQGPPPGAPGMGREPGPGDITYSGSIEALLAKDCMRCHLGPFRKMTTYEEVKMYVDNGLLKTLVEPGGQMHRFAGPDTKIFLQWIKAGAPR
ncbi:MAG: hypothetical protein HQK81_14280 [Desulfovibrionaceae bacterium]|nr:hypothetical protein [Desulfovibrionaceae bacterium]